MLASASLDINTLPWPCLSQSPALSVSVTGDVNLHKKPDGIRIWPGLMGSQSRSVSASLDIKYASLALSVSITSLGHAGKRFTEYKYASLALSVSVPRFAVVGTGVPISLGTPVRHPSSKARKYAPSFKSFRRCCTPVPPTRKVRRPFSASNRNVAPQFREQDESGTSVPLRAKNWHLSSSNKIKVAPQFH